MSNSLEDRLKTHSNAFDGLLSLIPAKYYYDEATQDQWNQKKKSNDEIKQNKRNKLDPNFNQKVSAEDIMRERAKTAKPVQLPKKFERPAVIEQDDEHEDDEDEDEDEDDDEDDDVEIPDMDVDDEDEDEDENKDEDKDEVDQNATQKNGKFVNPKDKIDDDDDDDDSIQIEFDDEGNEINAKDKDQNQKERISNEIPSKKAKKQLSEEEQKKKQENLIKLRDRLANKINILKEKRKAPGTKTGGTIKSREQILEDRKRKAELKKQEKLKRSFEEMESDSDNSDNSDNEGEEENNVYFGNITFNDGTRLTSDLTKSRSTAEKQKAKGPSNNDIKAHLLKLDKKKQKLSKLSPEEQVKQVEKDKWRKLMNQAEGIKVKDDEKLLKKALKRKEKKKLKSEIEWKDRKQIVKDTMAAKVKRRDENLKLRKENKGKKRKDQVRLKKFTGIVNNTNTNKSKNKKKRAGFEGSAKSKKK